MRIFPGGMALLALLASSCRTEHTVLTCDACIEKEGQIFCGRTQTDQRNEKVPVTEDQGKLTAAHRACVEYAARKGGGYQGPPFHDALVACHATITPKMMIRASCSEEVVHQAWTPQEGL